ncbi:SUMF1/EgtB/PvdO family nonheme iron enzyme [Candidatus Poribacteria bacterium]|nr:SUMF1/EgtB/PvdO family nonheme iron enzyme [Candidatus Poribacteria bacterium]
MRIRRECFLHFSLYVLMFLWIAFPRLGVSEETVSETDVAVELKAKASTVRIVGGNLARSGKGSGFFVEPDKVVTNLHVVLVPGPIFVRLDNNREIWSVESVTAYDMENDLAILKITGTGIPLPLADSNTVEVDDVLYASGYPGGGEYKFTKGVLHNSNNRENLLETSVVVFGGSSGGPMLNVEGEVVGICVSRSDLYSYAVVSNALRTLLLEENETIPIIEWYKNDDTRAYSLYHQGHRKHYLNDFDSAIDDMDESIRLSPNFVKSNAERGHLHSHLGDLEAVQGRIDKTREHYQDCFADYAEVIRLTPTDNLAYTSRGYVYAYYGQIEADHENLVIAKEQYEASLADYNKAISLEPEYDVAFAGRGRVRYLFGDLYAKQDAKITARKLYMESIDDYNVAVKLNPKEDAVYGGRGWAKYRFGQFIENNGNVMAAKTSYRDAMIDIDKAIELDSEVAVSFYRRGMVKVALHLYKSAIEDFDVALNLNSYYKDAYTARGESKVELGRLDEAKVDFLKAKQSIGQGEVSSDEIERASKEMILVPGGEFQMGSKSAYAAPEHTVYVDAFYIDAYEVTNAQFKAFVDANPEWRKDNIPRKYHNGRYLRLWDGDTYPEGKGNHPVVYVSWYAAMAYANWVGKRLPTEAEWEKAARGGVVDDKYVWGDVRDPVRSNYGYYDTNTLPVGSYLPNGFGLYDMGGNVLELCLDEYDKDSYLGSAKENPLFGEKDKDVLLRDFLEVSTRRVWRGGSWNSRGPTQTADRGKGLPSTTNSWLGFRCVIDGIELVD